MSLHCPTFSLSPPMLRPMHGAKKAQVVSRFGCKIVQIWPFTSLLCLATLEPISSPIFHSACDRLLSSRCIVAAQCICPTPFAHPSLRHSLTDRSAAASRRRRLRIRHTPIAKSDRTAPLCICRHDERRRIAVALWTHRGQRIGREEGRGARGRSSRSGSGSRDRRCGSARLTTASRPPRRHAPR